MEVDFEKFRKWAEEKFKGDVLVKTDQIRINSIFEKDDSGHHLWCSPSGGKNRRPFGVYHCFKTDEKGSLLKLVKIVEKCDSDEAIAILTGRSTITDLENKIAELLSNDNYNFESEPIKLKLALPNGCSLISSMSKNNWWRERAEEYLLNRKIPIDDLYICKEPPFKGRIVIPYYDRNCDLIYFNGRHISSKATLRYMGPPISCGTGKEDVVFMAGPWPNKGSTLYVCEGEFNAMSLKISGLNACACGGKNLSEKQAMLLSDYKIIFCLDRDKAGASGLKKMVELTKRFSHNNSSNQIKCTQPPNNYNDWNQMLINLGSNVLREYIIKTQKEIDFDAPSGMAGDIFDI